MPTDCYRSAGLGSGTCSLRCCTRSDVRHNAMPGVDLSKYHTYKWINIRRWRSPEPSHGCGNQAVE